MRAGLAAAGGRRRTVVRISRVDNRAPRPRAVAIEYRRAVSQATGASAPGDVVISYPVDDPFGLAAELSGEEQLIASTVRDWVRRRFLPIVGDAWRAGACRPSSRASSASSACSACTSRATAAPGASATAYGLACLELEAGDSGLRSLVSVQGSLAMFAIHRFGSEEQKQRWLPAMAAGEVIGCFGLTEPDAGSDPGSMRTSARRDGDDWILNGTKMWITNGSRADVAVVWARTDEGVSGFLVPGRHRGLPHRRRPGQAVAARLDDLRAAPRGLPARRRRAAARGRARCAARCRASTRRATGSSGAPSARPAPASRRRSTTPRRASSSARRSPRSRSSSRSSSRCTSRSTTACCSRRGSDG